MADYPVHPAADLFPMMGGEAYEHFRTDIAERGQQEPVALWRGQVVDGRNRLRACRDLGVEPRTVALPDDADPVGHVLSANLHRRHLTESQRAVVGAKVKPLLEAEARERQRRAALATNAAKKGEALVQNSAPAAAGKTRDQAADLVSVSHFSIDKAAEVLDRGTAGLLGMVERGEVSVSAAAAVSHLPKPDQEQVVSEGPEAVKRKAKEIREARPAMPAEGREQGRRAELGERWQRCLHDLYMVLNSVRDAGGIERVAAACDEGGRAKIGGELGRIAETLQIWVRYLKGGSR
jgi:hypothetical protein